MVQDIEKSCIRDHAGLSNYIQKLIDPFEMQAMHIFRLIHATRQQLEKQSTANGPANYLNHLKRMSDHTDEIVENGFIAFECRRAEWASAVWQQVLSQFLVAMQNDGNVSQGGSGETIVYGFQYAEEEMFDKSICQYFWLPPIISSLGPPLSKDYSVKDDVKGAKGLTDNADFSCSAWPAAEPPNGMDRLLKNPARIECFHRHAAFAQRSGTLVDMMKVVLCGCSHKYSILQQVPITYNILQELNAAEDFDINDFIPESDRTPATHNAWEEVHRRYRHYSATLSLTDTGLITTVMRCIEMMSEGLASPPENRTGATTALTIMCKATNTDAAEAASQTTTFLGCVEEYILLGDSDYFYNECPESQPPPALLATIRNLLSK